MKFAGLTAPRRRYIEEGIDIDDVEFTEELVEKHLLNIDPNKSNIAECIHPRILKECATVLKIPITKIFKISLELGTCPSMWKNGIIIIKIDAKMVQ